MQWSLRNAQFGDIVACMYIIYSPITNGLYLMAPLFNNFAAEVKIAGKSLSPVMLEKTQVRPIPHLQQANEIIATLSQLVSVIKS